VVQDRDGNTWVTVSTRLVPRALGYRRSCNDGFIVCVRPDGQAFVAAEGLGYTNEVAVHPSGRWLYVNETFSRRLSRFALRSDGRLSDKQVVAEFGAGTFPDGLAFDEEGSAWVVSIVSNRLIRVAPDGTQTLWLEDADAEHLAGSKRPSKPDGWTARTWTASAAACCATSRASPSRADRRTAVLGCLLDDRLATLKMPVAGVPPIHWNHP
jgi:hypothetical protein